MAVDGLKMIHIAGYDGDPEEYFEGLGGGLDLSALIGLGGGGSTGGTPSDVTVTVTPNVVVNVPPTSLPTQPIPVPDKRNWLEKALADSEPVLDAMLGFFGTEAPNVGLPDEDDGGTDRGISRSPGRSRVFGALVPILGSLAGAAKLLPAVLKGGAGIQILLSMLNEVGKDIEDFIDPLDPGWRLKAIEEVLKDALLIQGLDTEGGIDARVSILKEGLLTPGLDLNGSLDMYQGVLKQALLVKGFDFEGGIDSNTSILKEAFLRPGVDVDGTGADLNVAYLEDIEKALKAMQAAQDMPPIQEEIDIGDVRIISGKIIEY